MDDELRAAAERAMLCYATGEYKYMKSGEVLSTLAAATRAWLADNPADSELPVTEERLRSIGFGEVDHGVKILLNQPHRRIEFQALTVYWLDDTPDCGVWLIEILSPTGGIVSLPLPAPENMGDVRRLLRALGIEAKE